MTKVDLGQDIYTQLKASPKSGASAPREFPEWDILKELDRRARRKQKDSGVKIRKYMREHPEEVERIREKAASEKLGKLLTQVRDGLRGA